MLNRYLDPKCDLPCPDLVDWKFLVGRPLVIIEVGPRMDAILTLPTEKHAVIVQFADAHYSVKDLSYNRRKRIRPQLIRSVHQAILYDPMTTIFYQTKFPHVFGQSGFDGVSTYAESGVPELMTLVTPAPTAGIFNLYPTIATGLALTAVDMPHKVPELSKLCPRHFTFDQITAYWSAQRTAGDVELQNRIRDCLAELDIASRYIFIKRMAQHVYPQA